MMSSNRANRNELIVVTGASTGIGAATARELARKGFHVLAGVRRDADAEALRAQNIEPHILDITMETDVAAIADRVARDPLRRPLRALVNNAGIAVNSPVETLPIDQWRRQFEVNLFGHIAMTQKLLPALLLSGGTVVNISSVGGKVVLPTYGAYAGSKFALEAASDALRREVAELGIKVVVVEPGAVKTEMAERGISTAEGLMASLTEAQLARYGDLIGAVTAQARSFGEEGVSAEHAAKVVAKAATAPRPRTRYTIGRDAAILLWINRVVSDRGLDRIVRQNLRSFARKSQAREQRSAATTSVGL
ncbi:dehydrogenase [Mycobacterium sp. 1165196.3]|uniref:SDR family NAD(P)-dependent oxidoreductase n=1 Tax=unclassified Mycobacterium TaxID=2642494 RepID=UPI000801A5EE|nr:MULTISPECIES: SDR family NAD(P)-dependent oxidoreductase [unclassified Mycobacterium]OBJ08981.1 dehydrogenase [Mycobacterium sp. 1482292.6]OBJ15442.1 dehydrogenase [Mycobacterium sp. 1245801.1]OBK42453.1 dehydrogenase [Mycobacterium sp. 1165196.3]OBL13928.1 dehydrogenase [Mycobacterium sp. 1245499.0]